MSTESNTGDTPPADDLPATPVTPDTSNKTFSKAELDAAIAEALKNMKANLDRAYEERDTARAEVAVFKQKEREAEIQRLKDEGKHKEAHEAELATLRQSVEELQSVNLTLTRDNFVNSTLSTFEFRNDKARQMAFQEITAQLVRDESGEWLHKSGTSIADFSKSFREDEANAFLFKKPVSSGSGVQSTTTSAPSTGGNLFEKSFEEVVRMAREGKLPK